jgi:FHS family glucose/mannose:H+ symporter-like MFS transporter
MALNLSWCVGAVAAPIPIASLPAAFQRIQALLAIVLAQLNSAVPWPAQRTGRKLCEDHSRSSHLLSALLLFLYVGLEDGIGSWVALLTLRSLSTQSLWAILPSAFWAGMSIGRMVAPSLLDVLRSRVMIIAGLLLASAAAAYLMGGGRFPLAHRGRRA